MKLFQNNLARVIGCLFISMITVQSAQSAQLDVIPDVTSAQVGDFFNTDVVISDFGQGGVGAFDISLAFDNSLLRLDSITFGNGLDLGFFGSLQFSSDNGASVQVDETSFEDEMDLIVVQLDPLLLFSISFETLASGTSALDLTVNGPIADASGFSDVGINAINNASVRISSVSTASSVPEPEILTLLAIGLISVRMTRRARR